MRKNIAILFLFLNYGASAQIVNTSSSDRTNMYFHAADSLIQIAKQTMKLRRVFVASYPEILQPFPDSIDGLVLTKVNKTQKRQRVNLGEDEILINIRPVSIIKDQFTIQVLAAKKGGRFEDGIYLFYYKYIPESSTYILRKIKKGILL